VNLPATSDQGQVFGTLDLEEAIRSGKEERTDSVLSRADGNILVIDDANLMRQSLLLSILEAAEEGMAVPETSSPYSVDLKVVCTMNPEEGDLRPQLLDRFGLVVEIRGEQDIALRSELIRRRLAYEADPAGFCRTWAPEQETLREKVRLAQERLAQVVLPDSLFRDAARIGVALQVDGHRSDITLLKAAATLAAFEGAETATREHLVRVAPMVLTHRMRRLPFDTATGLPEDWESVLHD
jgi:magnesium chelatase subunit I